MTSQRCRSTLVIVAAAVLGTSCTESRPAPLASPPSALRIGDDASAVLAGDVSIRVAPVGEVARREVRYHMRRVKRDGKWHATLLLRPLASGMPAEHDLARIEIDGDGVMRSFNRAGAEMRTAGRGGGASSVPPSLGGVSATPSGAVAGAAGGLGLDASYLVDAREAARSREQLVRRFGTPRVTDGREMFTATEGQSRSAFTRDARSGAIVAAEITGTDGARVDLAMSYREVRPGLHVRTSMSSVVKLPGMKKPIRTEAVLSNIHLEGQQ